MRVIRHRSGYNLKVVEISMRVLTYAMRYVKISDAGVVSQTVLIKDCLFKQVFPGGQELDKLKRYILNQVS